MKRHQFFEWNSPLLTGITAAGNSCLLRSASSAPGRLWPTGLPERCKEKNQLTNNVQKTIFQITQMKLDILILENYLTLNAEEVLPCVHRQAGLVAGRRQCCDITRKDKHATEYQTYFRTRLGLIKMNSVIPLCTESTEKSCVILTTSAPFCASFPPHEVLSWAVRRAGVSPLGVPEVFLPSSSPEV